MPKQCRSSIAHTAQDSLNGATAVKVQSAYSQYHTCAAQNHSYMQSDRGLDDGCANLTVHGMCGVSVLLTRVCPATAWLLEQHLTDAGNISQEAECTPINFGVC